MPPLLERISGQALKALHKLCVFYLHVVFLLLRPRLRLYSTGETSLTSKDFVTI